MLSKKEKKQKYTETFPNHKLPFLLPKHFPSHTVNIGELCGTLRGVLSEYAVKNVPSHTCDRHLRAKSR